MPLSGDLPVLVEPALGPRDSLARDRFLLDAVVTDPGRWPAALRVYEVGGDAVSIGRWQRAPMPGGGVGLMRRHSGGRAAAFGAGFVGVSLVVPRRGALLAEAAALRPEQVMNRYVRGVLRGLEAAGVPAVYPGRDTVTAHGRLLGVVSFTESQGGAVLVETLLATGGDPSSLPRLLDRADPEGVLRADMLQPADATSVAAERGESPGLRDVADWMARGHAERLGVTPVARTLEAVEAERVAALARTAFDDARWLAALGPRADLDRAASTNTMLGALDVRVGVAADGRIRDASIAGDLIAPEGTVPALEAALRGCPADGAAVGAAVERVLAGPGHFVLGIGPPATLVEAVMRALR